MLHCTAVSREVLYTKVYMRSFADMLVARSMMSEEILMNNWKRLRIANSCLTQ